MADNKVEKSSSALAQRFSLVELLTILLLVGLIFVFVVPVNQAKISRERINEAITIINLIGSKAEAFKNNPENDYYPDLSQLNLGDTTKSKYFNFSINTLDSTVVAISTKAFIPNQDSLYLVYSLSGKQYRIGKNDNDAVSKKHINENWLP